MVFDSIGMEIKLGEIMFVFCVAAINHWGKLIKKKNCDGFHSNLNSFVFYLFRCKATIRLDVSSKKLQFLNLNHNHGVDSNKITTKNK